MHIYLKHFNIIYSKKSDGYTECLLQTAKAFTTMTHKTATTQHPKIQNIILCYNEHITCGSMCLRPEPELACCDVR